MALTSVGVGALGLTAAPAAAAPAAPQLTYVEASGTGCPAGSVRATPTPDGAGVTVTYDQFEARSTGPVVRESCALRFTVTAAAGTRATTLAMEHRGEASVPAAGQGGVITSYRWGADEDPDLIGSWVKNGPYSGPWQISDKLSADGQARCGGTGELVVNVSAGVRGAGGVVQAETADGRLTSALRVGAERC